MNRPDDVELCCGSVCSSTEKLAYLLYLEERVKALEERLRAHEAATETDKK